MGNNEFIAKCKQIVADYFNDNVDVTNVFNITEESVYVVWCCKTLQNNKALLSTTVPDGMYYEITLNGDKQEIYLDVYKKLQNVCINV